MSFNVKDFNVCYFYKLAQWKGALFGIDNKKPDLF